MSYISLSGRPPPLPSTLLTLLWHGHSQANSGACVTRCMSYRPSREGAHASCSRGLLATKTLVAICTSFALQDGKFSLGGQLEGFACWHGHLPSQHRHRLSHSTLGETSAAPAPRKRWHRAAASACDERTFDRHLSHFDPASRALLFWQARPRAVRASVVCIPRPW